jgi:uncharacterized protein related to proFAR isomerase
MTLDIPLFYVKDKQAYRMDHGSLRMMGNPTQLVKKLAEKGAKLIHIVDLDAKRGTTSNMDIYDKLTYFVNIQVECSTKKDMIERLIGVKARVVLELGPDLSEWKKSERLLVGVAKPDYKGGAEGVHDVIIEDATEESTARFLELGKRILLSDSDYDKLDKKKQKLVWGVLRPI